MTLEELFNLATPYIEDLVFKLEINRNIFQSSSGREQYNAIIRKNINNKFGVYVWVIRSTNEIVYVGMAGKIKQDGTLTGHTLQKRLLASRYKDKEIKKYIQTNDFIRDFMVINDVENLDYYVLYSKENEPPSFIEALLLYHLYKNNGKLPSLNNLF